MSASMIACLSAAYACSLRLTFVLSGWRESVRGGVSASGSDTLAVFPVVVGGERFMACQEYLARCLVKASTTSIDRVPGPAASRSCAVQERPCHRCDDRHRRAGAAPDARRSPSSPPSWCDRSHAFRDRSQRHPPLRG